MVIKVEHGKFYMSFAGRGEESPHEQRSRMKETRLCWVLLDDNLLFPAEPLVISPSRVSNLRTRSPWTRAGEERRRNPNVSMPAGGGNCALARTETKRKTKIPFDRKLESSGMLSGLVLEDRQVFCQRK